MAMDRELEELAVCEVEVRQRLTCKTPEVVGWLAGQETVVAATAAAVTVRSCIELVDQNMGTHPNGNIIIVVFAAKDVIAAAIADAIVVVHCADFEPKRKDW